MVGRAVAELVAGLDLDAAGRAHAAIADALARKLDAVGELEQASAAAAAAGLAKELRAVLGILIAGPGAAESLMADLFGGSDD